MEALSVQRNGSVIRQRQCASKPVAPAKKRGKRGMQYAKRLAVGLGSVQAGLLALSVVHCTESIGMLTGSHWALAGLLAIGIDVGMLGSEVAEIAAHGTKGCESWLRMARAVVVGTVLLSVVLNGYAFSQHAQVGMGWAAWLLGATVPAMVYGIGRVACGLWLAGE